MQIPPESPCIFCTLKDTREIFNPCLQFFYRYLVFIFRNLQNNVFLTYSTRFWTQSARRYKNVEDFLLCPKSVMHRLRHVVIIYESSASECLLDGSKRMRIRSHVRNIGWVVENFVSRFMKVGHGMGISLRVCALFWEEHTVTVITGHGKTKSYLHRFKLADNPTCPCNEGVQTPEHIIHDCKILESQRSSLTRHIADKGGNWPPANDELVVTYWNAFSRFINSIDFQKLI